MLKIILIYTVVFMYYQLFGDPDNLIHKSILWAATYGAFASLCILGLLKEAKGRLVYAFLALLFLYGVMFELYQIVTGVFIHHTNTPYFNVCYITLCALFILVILIKYKVIKKWASNSKRTG